MRLIDADELRKAFKKSLFFTDVHLHYAREIIDKAPTVASDEDIKNFTLYNYPLKPGCNVTKTDDEKEISGLLEEGEE